MPTRRQLAFTVALSVAGAVGLNPITLNPFVEVLGEALFVGMVLLCGFKVAGAWRQTVLPRWVAQVLAVTLGAALSPFIVQMLSVGGDFSAFAASRPMVRGYVLVTLSAASSAPCSRSARSTASATRRPVPRRCSSRSNAKPCSARRPTRGCA